jgi:LEA14-like dessication related protein
VADAALSDLSLEAVTLDLDLEVSNPYSVALPLLGAEYRLSSGGRQFLSGAGEQGGSIPAGGKGTYPVTARIPFADLLTVLSGIKPGARVPYEAEMGLFVDAPALGKIELPVSHSGEFPVPAVPEVDLAEIKWDELSLTRVAASLSLDIKNTNDFPISLDELSYALKLGGVNVGKAGAERDAAFTAGGTERLTVPLNFSPMDAGIGLFNMLTGSGGSYEITGALKAMTDYGAVDLPFSRKGETLFSK